MKMILQNVKMKNFSNRMLLNTNHLHMSFISRYRESRRCQREVECHQFWEQNKSEVRYLYRILLKSTGRAIPRKIEREARIAELKYMFRHYQFEKDIDQANEIKMVFYTIVDRLEAGIYPPFPEFRQT